jgi:hypothetical protein
MARVQAHHAPHMKQCIGQFVYVDNAVTATTERCRPRASPDAFFSRNSFPIVACFIVNFTFDVFDFFDVSKP